MTKNIQIDGDSGKRQVNQIDCVHTFEINYLEHFHCDYTYSCIKEKIFNHDFL